MKTFFKKALIIILVICILLPSLFSNISLAESTVKLTTERAGNYMANFAILYNENWNENTVYEQNGSGNLNSDGKYSMSDYGFINFVISNSLALTEDKINNQTTSTTNYEQVKLSQVKVSSEDEGAKIFNDDGTINIAQVMSDSITKPGDILISDKAVFLYVGAGQVVYCMPDNNTLGITSKNGIRYEYMQQYYTRIKTALSKDLKENEKFDMNQLTQYQIKRILRIKGDGQGFTTISESSANLIFAGKGYNEGESKYYGIPSFGSYKGSTSLFSWLIDLIKNILNYLIGIMTLGIKIQLIGWTNIVANMISDLVLSVSGQDTNRTSVDEINGAGATSTKAEQVTVETIILNKVGILDINFFNYTEAGGVILPEKSIIGTLRELIAKWYYIIRAMSITIMLLILIYTGIKLAITSISEKKALYKKVLIDWVIGFVIIIIIHYFMLFIININETLVGIFFGIMEKSTGGESIYETVRTKAYSLKFTEGFAGTIMYMYLVYILIRFFFIYIKRYLTVNILALMGPIMGIRYALDKVGGKKTSKALISWMFDFTMNVFIQLVHALIYVSFMSMAYALSGVSLAGFIVALVILNFLLKADKLIMKIFKFNQSASVGDTAQPESLTRKMAELYGGAKIATGLGFGMFRYIKRDVNTAIGYPKRFLEEFTGKDSKKSLEKFGFKVKGGAYRALNRVTGSKIHALALRARLGQTSDYKLNKALNESLKANRKLKNKSFSRAIGFGKDVLGGAAKIMVSVPMAIAEPSAGISMMIMGYNKINKNFKNTNKVDDRRKNRILTKQASYNKLQNNYVDNVLKLQQLNNNISAKGLSGTTDSLDNINKNIQTNEEQKELEKLVKKQEQKLFDKYEEYKKLQEGSRYSVKILDDMNSIKSKVQKTKKKLETIEKAQDLEIQIEDIYNDIKKEEMKEAIKEAIWQGKRVDKQKVNEKTEKQLNEIAKESINKFVNVGTIKTAVNDYVNENDTTVVEKSDAEGIIKKLEEILKDGKSKVTISSEARINIENELNSQITKKKRNENLKADDAISAISDALAKNGSIESKSTKNIKNSDLKDKYDSIQEKIRKLKALNDKASQKYGGQISDIRKFISEL